MNRGPDEENTVDVPDPRDRVLDGLRAYGAISAEIGKRFAGSLDLHPTDASALIEILEAEERGTPLSPARLSERIGLTSGATSSLLNRLEEGGHIERSRVHADRRIVTLRSTPGVQEVADAFFDPLAVQLNTMMSAYPDDLLTQFESFLAELSSTTEAYVRSLPS
ncbi:DNA-binding MarR family transcriptional regulator [Rhodococcus sp. SMB37]|uniref:MarR family winged helix-turn-helix transcriptional regulator n=1 Tax=Rhodococcus sp. SMB37 TaxID=2512213 RepID=UPI0010E0855A|nr:MarR family winged helix-turn-helix transcriptional regulator [Rhodococcus sp. SMB37]TCN53377.1 DNA-binding MarR family transcriptional regulator [Rhodococcus sp. SMB37]